MCIDQDDYYHPNSLKIVYDYLQNNNLDVLVCDSAFQYKGHESNKLQLNLKDFNVMTGEEFVIANGPVLAPWRFVIKREFYAATGISFVENCRIEDVDWSCKILYYAKKMQYIPTLLVHYIKGETGTTDTMYKNSNILSDNILASNRVLDLYNTIFRESLIRENIHQIADTYCNFSCKYLFGLFCPIKVKVSIIRSMKITQSGFTLVRLAIKFPYCYSIVSTMSVPIFRVLRIIHRKIKAVKSQN